MSSVNVMSKVKDLHDLISNFHQQVIEDIDTAEEDFEEKRAEFKIFMSSLAGDSKVILNTLYNDPEYLHGPNKPCSALMDVLQRGIADGFRQEIELMLKAGADVNERVTIHQVDTPLEFLIKFPPGYEGLYLEDVKPFVEHGAKITPRALKLAKQIDEDSNGVGSVNLPYGETVSLLTYLTEAKIDREIIEMKSVDEIIAKLKARFPDSQVEDGRRCRQKIRKTEKFSPIILDDI
jgi:hypothetical protein